MDVIKEVYGIIERVIGEKFIEWFEFRINNSNNDYFKIDNFNDNKIIIEGNNGIALAVGLNYYLKYYCNVNISQCGNQTKMPDKIIKLDEKVEKNSFCPLRYAYNYCTHSYSMAFWSEKEWDKEIDWLALNGVNLVLDLTGQEEVWRRFLVKLGYSDNEAREWIVGPAYIAWQHMANMSSYGGPLPTEWFTDRVKLARKNHRRMKALGMKPVLQGYSGMIPVDINEKNPNIKIIKQGNWNLFQRPSMVRTDSNDYEMLAKLFYKCQEEVYGKGITNFFATDPFHEGGNKDGIEESTVYEKVLDNLLKYDKEAIWVIQSWGDNPTQNALNGISREKRENLLILSLYSEVDPRYTGTSKMWGLKWNNKEFDETPWVWCMLNNFGGRSGMHGKLKTIAENINKAISVSEYMKGIGITPEATETNPILFDLIFETCWNNEAIVLNEWIKKYITRRYGGYSENAYKAWKIFKDTVYGERDDYHEGAPESIINARPNFNIKSASTWGSSKITYDINKFEKGVQLLFMDHDKLCNSEGYIYDLVDALKQAISNKARVYYDKFTEAYINKEYDDFNKYSNLFLSIIDLQDRVLSCKSEFSVGKWIEQAKSLGYDNKSRELFEKNAKTLITTWGDFEQSDIGMLHDYSNRQWSGLTKDLYLKRWKLWIEYLNKKKSDSNTEEIKWYDIENAWINNNKQYNKVDNNANIKLYVEEYFNLYK